MILGNVLVFQLSLPSPGVLVELLMKKVPSSTPVFLSKTSLPAAVLTSEEVVGAENDKLTFSDKVFQTVQRIGITKFILFLHALGISVDVQTIIKDRVSSCLTLTLKSSTNNVLVLQQRGQKTVQVLHTVSIKTVQETLDTFQILPVPWISKTAILFRKDTIELLTGTLLLLHVPVQIQVGWTTSSSVKILSQIPKLWGTVRIIIK